MAMAVPTRSLFALIRTIALFDLSYFRLAWYSTRILAHRSFLECFAFSDISRELPHARFFGPAVRFSDARSPSLGYLGFLDSLLSDILLPKARLWSRPSCAFTRASHDTIPVLRCWPISSHLALSRVCAV
ncbi:uncharacterized protein FOMMEDRAFT_17431 [Fomitiporia mediterranea MF3/22]|uniref:uncharacterized protein n=1 Tax=Fomitiporia mediterranea (strain MF3/22) TaxID=694068 RepID=UPI0004408644|nr:uncharacterized protein FOMMEDRAFT_17431 [Fomitiporia mediterranea MF3/22]EJD06975.1 hypothetical protein FOMMEDRAFT_17431 [Fomitiporia mediterranea MF3/22]